MKPPYKITAKILTLVSSISELIGEINAVHLSKPPTELRKKNRIKSIRSSLEIEGNTLSLAQITAIFENKKVVGPKKDIIEVKNAIAVYDQLKEFDPYSFNAFCKAHRILMEGLIDSPGKLRNKSVGIAKGTQLAHIAPKPAMLKPLLNDLFYYLRHDDHLLLIKSCVFHYELEFIHPFLDGNGRMGRLWQTLILMDKYPVFEYLPVEALIKEKQKKYYAALGKSDQKGESSIFIEFMLEIIKASLEDLLKTQNVALTNSDRISIYSSIIKDADFNRKDYLRNFKEISPATASRDLQNAVELGILHKTGDKNTTKYRYR